MVYKKIIKSGRLPHPIPYQGSKRNLARKILQYFPSKISTLYEPFAGSAAITIAAASNHFADRYQINDLNRPLMTLWTAIVGDPETLACQYKELWYQQLDDPKDFYISIREKFNASGESQHFLYLLARCVKAAVRYNSKGEFNQSADNRRKGMKPETMMQQIKGVAHLFSGNITITSKDYREILEEVTVEDLVYMDPPYQGVSGKRDHRYFDGVEFGEFVEALEFCNSRDIRYLISYDGKSGNKTYGENLPDKLNLTLVELLAGRSSQATLLGRNELTVESLYISPNLSQELRDLDMFSPEVEQLSLLKAIE